MITHPLHPYQFNFLDYHSKSKPEELLLVSDLNFVEVEPKKWSEAKYAIARANNNLQNHSIHYLPSNNQFCHYEYGLFYAKELQLSQSQMVDIWIKLFTYHLPGKITSPHYLAHKLYEATAIPLKAITASVDAEYLLKKSYAHKIKDKSKVELPKITKPLL